MFLKKNSLSILAFFVFASFFISTKGCENKKKYRKTNSTVRFSNVIENNNCHFSQTISNINGNDNCFISQNSDENSPTQYFSGFSGNNNVIFEQNGNSVSINGCNFTINGQSVEFFGNSNIEESGKIVSEDRKVEDFNNIVFKCPGKLVIIQDENCSLNIEADSNIIESLETFVENKTLIIKSKGITTCSTTPKYYISLERLENLTVKGCGSVIANDLSVNNLKIKFSGVGNINLKGERIGLTCLKKSGTGNINISGINTESLTLKSSGTGNLTLTGEKIGLTYLKKSGTGNINISGIKSEVLISKLSGPGSVTLSGEVDNQTAIIDGCTKYFADNLKSKSCNISTNGPSNASVFVIEKLVASSEGVSKITYKGNPQITECSSSFPSKIIKK